MVDPDLSQGGADGAQGDLVAVEQRLELGHLEIRQIEDISLQDRAELEVAETALFQDGYLNFRIGTDFIGESTQVEHGFLPVVSG
jgi:hypothetical protein